MLTVIHADWAVSDLGEKFKPPAPGPSGSKLFWLLMSLPHLIDASRTRARDFLQQLLRSDFLCPNSWHPPLRVFDMQAKLRIRPPSGVQFLAALRPQPPHNHPTHPPRRRRLTCLRCEQQLFDLRFLGDVLFNLEVIYCLLLSSSSSPCLLGRPRRRSLVEVFFPRSFQPPDFVSSHLSRSPVSVHSLPRKPPWV